MCLSITVINRALDPMKDLSELVKLLTFFLYLWIEHNKNSLSVTVKNVI